jgi:hypothetical protein
MNWEAGLTVKTQYSHRLIMSMRLEYEPHLLKM